MENLLLLSVTSNFESYEEEFNFIVDCCCSDIDRNTLKIQLETLSASYEKDDKKDVRLSDVLEFFRQLSKSMLGMFSEVVTLIKLFRVMPATNASSERTLRTKDNSCWMDQRAATTTITSGYRPAGYAWLVSIKSVAVHGWKTKHQSPQSWMIIKRGLETMLQTM